MKRYFLTIMVAAFFAACTNSEIKESEAKLDKAGDKLQKTVEKGADTIGAKLKKLKNKLDDKR